MVGDVSFTADIWSSDARRPYLALTGHWIAEDTETKSLSLRSALLGFHRLRGSHTGESLARTILYLLDRAGVTTKTGHFTLDNAENNKTMMEHLEKLLQTRELPLEFGAQDRKVMCFPHIINICVQHVIEEFAAPDLETVANAWVDCFDDDAVDKEKYLEAVKKNPVALGRDVVRIIRASGLRRDEFDKIIVTGNLQQWFKSPAGTVVQIPEVQLLRDVKTRWDSIFYMLNRLLALHLAIECFLSLLAQKDLANFKMTDMEWFVLQEFEVILDVNVDSFPLIAVC